MSSSSEAPRASTILTMTTVTTRLTKGTTSIKRHLNVTMTDGVKYKIKCSKEISELLERQDTLKRSVADVERAIKVLIDNDLKNAHTRVESIKGSVAAEEARIEEARKELEACEKGLVAAQKEAKKRGKTVSKGTEAAVVRAKEHFETISTSSKFGGIVFLRGCLNDAEKNYNEARLEVDKMRNQIAHMSAEMATNKSRVEEFVIEYVTAHPKTDDEFDI